jgi:hypothetical protein
MAPSVIKKLPKKVIAQNSPNLVTLESTNLLLLLIKVSEDLSRAGCAELCRSSI